MAEPDSRCLFCRLVAGEIPATVVRDDELTLAFRDVNPQAPTHVLVVTKAHYPDVAMLAAEHPGALVALHRAAAAVAAAEGVAGPGWRLVFNTGPDAGQSVPHVHGHVLGGRQIGWPPG
ncbi:MAG: HIT domain-containing protein [Mycobacteriales bacterium]